MRRGPSGRATTPGQTSEGRRLAEPRRCRAYEHPLPYHQSPPPRTHARARVCVPAHTHHHHHHPTLQVGGSGVLVQPMTYIFDAEPPRWRALLQELGLTAGSVDLP